MLTTPGSPVPELALLWPGGYLLFSATCGQSEVSNKNNQVVLICPQQASQPPPRRIVGVSQRRLDYWDERGIVTPSLSKADGKGSERRYAFDDLLKLTLVKKLRSTGLSLQKIRKGLEIMRKRWPKEDPLLDEVLVADGAAFYRIKDKKVEDILAGGQLVFSVVAVGRIRQELRESVVKLRKTEIPRRGVVTDRLVQSG